jgi:hypothetical protein
MYDDSPAPAVAPPGDQPEGKEGDEDRPTFIVPKSAFGGKDIKPGDKCDIEVCMVHENDVECYPCEPGEHDEEKEKPAAEAPAAQPPAGDMSSMME